MPEQSAAHASHRFAQLRGILIFLVFSAVLIWIFLHLSALGMDYEWHWNRAWRQLGYWTEKGFRAGPLLEGVWLTAGIAASGFILSAILGLAAAVMRLSPWPCCVFIARSYICLWRNTPLLLQLFFVYFLVAPLFSLGPFTSAVLALAAFEGAYAAEIFRAALLSVPRGQWEAALALGLSLGQTLRMVIIPQAGRNALPAFINQAVCVIKDTSLAGAIAVADITMKAQAIIAETFLAFEVWLIAGFIYLLLTLCISLPGLWLERRMR